MKQAHVLVLGDASCSPRTVAHAEELAKIGYSVNLYGYSKSPSDISKHVKFSRIPDWTKFSFVYPKLIQLFLKFLFTLLYLLILFCLFRKTNVIFVQNPPSLPIFLFIYLLSRFKKTENIVIDWHNYGYTLTNSTIIRKIYFLLECKFGQKYLMNSNFTHLTVSNAFTNDLRSKYGIEALTVYDKPRIEICTTSPKRAHEIFTKLSEKYSEFLDQENSIRRTILTEMTTIKSSPYRMRNDRPAFIVSSCSWTTDDNIEILIEALEIYDKLAEKISNKKKLLCCITGKGPLKGYYKNMIEKKEFTMSKVILPWLDNEDYFDFIGAADFGVCLHNSTSGLDLPMKIVDLNSRAVPAIALEYSTLHELVLNNINGFLFKKSDELAEKIDFLLNNEKGICELESAKTYLINQYDTEEQTWTKEWRKIKDKLQSP